jgi:lysophospholipase L1-like esterase
MFLNFLGLLYFYGQNSNLCNNTDGTFFQENNIVKETINSDVSEVLNNENDETKIAIYKPQHSQSQSHKNILVLGDSNGALEYGWVNQLKKIVPNDCIFNTSRPGNTIGFDNNGSENLNTLKNLDSYLSLAQDSLGSIDDLLIMLGTNDAKFVFKDRQDEVISNMEVFITRIHNYDFNSGTKPKIIIMSPPPYGSNKMLAEKYQGGSKRVKRITRNFKKLAKKYECDFVNVYRALKPVFNNCTKDGVHLNEEGQKEIAALVAAQLVEK